MMRSAYGRAVIEPARKSAYNLILTTLSVLVALIVGGIEGAGLIHDRLDMRALFWTMIDRLNDHFGTIGYLIIGIFAAGWAASWGIDRRQSRNTSASNY